MNGIDRRRIVFCFLQARSAARSAALCAVLCAAICVSCSADAASMKDGYYTAEAAEFDEHGWKEYVTICVSGGRIILIEYNAYNPTGLVKSWDMDYMRVMNAVDGTYPNAYTRMYGRQFLVRQSADVDCISGATNSYYSFVRLAGAVLENARSGDSSSRQVNLTTPEISGRAEH